MTNVWYHFKREGIQIPFPIRTVEMTEVDRVAEAEKEAAERRARALAEAEKEAAERRARALAVFEGVDIFSPLNKKELESLAAAAEIRVYGAGETIFRQGDPGEELFVVESGRLKITIQDDGRTIFSKDRGPGYLFGEMALLTGEPRTASIKALVDTETIVIGKKAFEEIVKRDPSVIDKLGNIIEKRRKAIAEGKEPEEPTPAAAETEEEEESVLDKIRDFFNL
jgi:CRP-like cAMP-binding protein